MKLQKTNYFFLLFAAFSMILLAKFGYCQSGKPAKIPIVLKTSDPNMVVLKGMIGQAANASRQGRLKSLPTWEDGKLIKMFSKEEMDTVGMDWIGEHAGKWMFTATRAAKRTNDTELLTILQKTADYLVSKQEADGYLGTYAPAVRMTADKGTIYDERITDEQKISYRGRIRRSARWDVWNQTYIVLGLLEINRFWPNESYLNAAVKIGELCLKTFGKGGKNLALGGHSSTILLEPIVELYRVTGDQKYLDFAKQIIDQTEERPDLQFISHRLKGFDLSATAGGKIYQLCWNYMCIAKLYEETGNPDYLKAVQKAWENIVEKHLTLSGGPWGSIGGGTSESFSSERGLLWTPYGCIETCSIMSWIHMNRELLRITGQAKYAEEIEKSVYNALIGAQYLDGEHWCYFTFPNGKRHYARYRDCCRSSGALALEEIAPLVLGKMENGVSVNIYTESEGIINLANAGKVEIVQKTDYPIDGKIRLVVSPEKESEFPLFLRIPNWADETSVEINDKKVTGTITKGAYLKLDRKWKQDDKIVLDFPMKIDVHKKTISVGNREGIYRIDWMAFTRGPLVYATNGLIDGKEREEVLNLPKENPEVLFSACPTPLGFNGPGFQLNAPNRKPILFLPYYEAGGRSVGTWRLTWIQSDL